VSDCISFLTLVRAEEHCWRLLWRVGKVRVSVRVRLRAVGDFYGQLEKLTTGRICPNCNPNPNPNPNLKGWRWGDVSISAAVGVIVLLCSYPLLKESLA